MDGWMDICRGLSVGKIVDELGATAEPRVCGADVCRHRTLGQGQLSRQKIKKNFPPFLKKPEQLSLGNPRWWLFCNCRQLRWWQAVFFSFSFLRRSLVTFFGDFRSGGADLWLSRLYKVAPRFARNFQVITN